MEKTIISIILLLLIIPISSASLLIDPNPKDITVPKGETKEFSIELTNTYNFTILGFEFSNLEGFTFPEIELTENETKIINFSVKRDIDGDFSLNSEVAFKYLVDLPEDIQIYEIIIDDDGFDPNFLPIRKGDTVRWTNKADGTRTVTSEFFDYTLSVNESAQYNFQNVMEISYQDLVTFASGVIQVLNETELEQVNNPELNRHWTVNLDVTLDPTNLIIINEEDNFTVESTGSVESLLNIKNSGSEVAQKIKLTSQPDWIKFDENNFNIDPDERNYVTYYIEPKLFETDKTNKTYELNIIIKGSNTEQYNKTIEVFIPYNDVFSDLSTEEGFLANYEMFCRANPSFLLCNNTIQEQKEVKCDPIEPSIPINLTQREFYEVIKRVQRIEDSMDRANNEYKKTNNIVNNELPVMRKLINDSISMQVENERRTTRNIRTFWWLFFFVLIIGLIFWVGNAINKKNKRATIKEGGMRIIQ